jgi:hypothetical protein
MNRPRPHNQTQKGALSMATSTHKALQAIPQDVRHDLLVLRILEVQMRQTRKAIASTRKRVATRMLLKDALRLVRDEAFCAALWDDRNRRAAKRVARQIGAKVAA